MGVRKMLVSGKEEEEGLRPGHAGLWLLRATGAKQRGQSLVPPPASAPWCQVQAPHEPVPAHHPHTNVSEIKK